MKSLLLAIALGALLTAPDPMQRPDVPPPAWADVDPADSLYRAARRAINQRDYDEAARLFEAIVSKFPRSEYAPDALYWKGFALYRDGKLDAAVVALEAQAQRYPKAATIGDASALVIQIKGQLAMRGNAAARRAVDNAATGSERTCDDMDVQVAALDALQQMESARVVPLLRRVLARRDACSVSLRKNALFILAQKSGAEREAILLDLVKNDPSSQVRQDAVFYLSQSKSDASMDALEHILLRTDDMATRKNALFALSQRKNERATRVLRALVLSNDTPLSLRNDAVFHLAHRSDVADASWLLEAYAKTTDSGLRKNLLFYIAQRPTAETSRWLQSVILDPKENASQRKDALFHLANRREGSLDLLISIAKTAPSADLRKDALFYIGQSKDPRALKALEEIVAP